MTRYSQIEADITKMKVDIIVNAAGQKMLGGGGVDGAIHRAAGPDLLKACRAFPCLGLPKFEIRLLPGDVRITPAFNLPCKYIIHTLGPLWNADKATENARALAGCYMHSLQLALLYNAKTIAFPAISTGIFGYPIREACEIAVEEVKTFLDIGYPIEHVFFVTWQSPEVTRCFDILKVPKHA